MIWGWWIGVSESVLLMRQAEGFRGIGRSGALGEGLQDQSDMLRPVQHWVSHIQLALTTCSTYNISASVSMRVCTSSSMCVQMYVCDSVSRR